MTSPSSILAPALPVWPAESTYDCGSCGDCACLISGATAAGRLVWVVWAFMTMLGLTRLMKRRQP